MELDLLDHRDGGSVETGPIYQLAGFYEIALIWDQKIGKVGFEGQQPAGQ